MESSVRKRERMERRVRVDPPERFRTRIVCFAVEAFFIHQELVKWFPARSRRDVILDQLGEEDKNGMSWLAIETDAPLSLQQRQFLTSCGLSIDQVDLVEV